MQCITSRLFVGSDGIEIPDVLITLTLALFFWACHCGGGPQLNYGLLVSKWTHIALVLLTTVLLVPLQRQRTVYRLTLVKAWNVEEMLSYSELIAVGQPDFIEVKVGLIGTHTLKSAV